MNIQEGFKATSAEAEFESECSTYYQYERPEILELIPNHAKRILDIGCAAGWLGEAIKRRQACTVYGIEANPGAAKRAAERIDKVWNAHVEQIIGELDAAYFDCIVLADVLEHLIDPWSVLKALRAKLVEGGKIVTSIPNICNWNIVDDLIKGRWQYESEGLLDRSHLRFFTLRSIRELFWNAELRIIELKTSKRDVAFASKKSVAAIKKIKLPAESIKEQGAVFQYLVVCQKLPCREDSPKVSIVVLNWNRKADTLECLKSLKTIKYDNFEVVVVDNGSTDDSVQAIQQSFPDVSLIETGENLGYAGGNNAGLRHALNAGAKWVLVLNNDTVVDPMILRRFIQAGELIPDAGVLGAKVYFYSEPKRIWHAGATCLDGLAHFRSLGYGCLDNGQDFSSIREVDYVYGCAFFIATETIKIVGLFDEKFFLTHEDVDWCLRAKRLGLKCIFVPEAHVWHKCSVSFGGEESPAYKYFLMRGKLLWARKNLEAIQRCHFWVSVFRELFGDYFGSLSLSRWSRSPQYRYSRQVYWLISHWIQEFRENYARPEFRAKLYGLRDYLLGRFGYEEETIRTLK